MNKLKIALCGCRGHVEKFGTMINSYEESEVVAVWDNVPGRGEKVAENLACAFEPDYDKLLSEYDLDGVAIIAENSLHRDMIVKAAKAGKSIFVEKPLCVSVSEAHEIQKVIHETGVKFYMTDPFVRSGTLKVKELIDSCTLGDITGATFRLGGGAALSGHMRFSRQRDQGGIMADVGGHMIHKAHFLFGKPCQITAELSSYTEQCKNENIEDNALIIMRYPDGKLVSLECSSVCGGNSSFEMVYGTKGCTSVTSIGREEGEECVTLQQGREEPQRFSGSAIPQNPKRHVRYWVEMMAYDIPNDMVGVDPLSNSGVSIDNAVEFVEIIDAIYRSAGHGPVSL